MKPIVYNVYTMAITERGYKFQIKNEQAYKAPHVHVLLGQKEVCQIRFNATGQTAMVFKHSKLTARQRKDIVICTVQRHQSPLG